MNRTRTMALAGALLLGGSLGVGTPAIRAQTYTNPAGVTYYQTYAYPAGGTYYSPSPGYAPAAGTPTAPPWAPADDAARITTLEERIRELESQLQRTGGSEGPVLDFTGHDG